MLRLIRGYAGAALFYFMTALSAVVLSCASLAPVPMRWRHKVICTWGHLVMCFLSWFCGLRYTVAGLENIPPVPVICACKHQSAWEVLALAALLRKKSFVLKRELHYIPFIGWNSALVMKSIAIDRKMGASALRYIVRRGTERLQQGFSIVIFPEGTRMEPGVSGFYHPGLGCLAAATECPVIPIAHNAGWFWRRREFFKRPGCVSMQIGRPIPTAGKKAKQINAEVRQRIEEMCAGLPAPSDEA